MDKSIDNTLVISSSPHVSANNTTRKIMLDVIIALLPSIVASTVIFGYMALINCIVCALSCFVFELLYEVIFNKKKASQTTAKDLSCVVTGIIFALNLPTYISVWGWNIKSGDVVVFSFDTILICILGSLFAIAIVKMLFGGIGKNFANPAMAARVFLFLAFSTSFATVFSTDTWGKTITTGATWLTDDSINLNGKVLLDFFIGKRGSAAVGETCIVAILLGYIYLSIKKIIDWRLPLIIVGSLAVFVLLFDGILDKKLSGAMLIKNTLAHILNGGIIFAAVFMATDYSTSPNTFFGGVIFGIGIALITSLIRVYGSYPEGISFAILIMNIATPLIDKYIVPHPFGYVKPSKNKTKSSGETKKAEVK